MQKRKIPDMSLIAFMSNMVKAHGGINLAQGVPSFKPPRELIKALLLNGDKNFHQYAPGDGDFNLVECIKREHKAFDLDSILVTNGATEAISLIYFHLLRKFGNAFTVMAFSPVYESYANLPLLFGQKLVTMESDTLFDKDSFKKFIIENDVKLLFIASPGNPYGKIWNKENLDFIVELAEKLNFYIVLDVVYKNIYFDKPAYIPEVKVKNLFITDSFSKMLSITGWRVGFLLAEESEMIEIKKIHAYTGLSSSSILQKTIADYLGNRQLVTQYTKELRHFVTSSYLHTSNKLKEMGFSVPRVDGGYFIWAGLPEKYKNCFDFAVELYEKERVAVVPGIHFSKEATNKIRINVAVPIPTVNEGLLKIENFIN